MRRAGMNRFEIVELPSENMIKPIKVYKDGHEIEDVCAFEIRRIPCNLYEVTLTFKSPEVILGKLWGEDVPSNE